MELSELTNKELKDILRQNQVKNYSKLNKKDLVKKLNQLIKAQNGGNSGKKNNRKNGKKKYTLKQLIGGGDPPGEPAGEPADGDGTSGAITSGDGTSGAIISGDGTSGAIISGDGTSSGSPAEALAEGLPQTSNNSVTSKNGKNDEQCKACTIL
jgi:hypothetical protein